jgi:hypothetical protein
MNTRLLTVRLAAIAAALALLVAGCIVSVQKIIVVNISDEMVSTDEAINAEAIDLTDNEDWEEHKDEIQSVIDLKFACTIVNNEGTAATGRVYLSEDEYTTPEDIDSLAVLFLDGIVIPANDSVVINFTGSAPYIHNLDPVLDLVEGGQFYIYGIAEDTPFSITIRREAKLMITFSAG